MSTFVLQREYALQLPNSFIEIDKEEMEYVEGGSAREWAIGIACSLIANTPVALAIVSGTVGIGVGVVLAYYGLRR